MWRLLQLADSGFPTGGYAHSGGLEAAIQLGELVSLRRWLDDAVWAAAHGALVLVRQAHREGLGPADRAAQIFLTGHVARRASLAQGRALAAAAARAFPACGIDSRGGHWAPVLGAVAAALGLGVDDACVVALHTIVRGALSAAVRLGKIGPLEAQRVQAELADTMTEAVRVSAGVDAPVQTAPVAEICGGMQDGLYSRLFQS